MIGVIHKNRGYMKYLIYLVVTISFLYQSCASSGPAFQSVIIDHETNPVIYIYRPNSVCLMSAKQQFLIDDNLITLRNNEYSFVSVKQGSHKVISGEFKNLHIPPLITEINTVRGKSYYIKYDISCDSKYLLDSPKFNIHLAEVNETMALEELSQTHLTNIQMQKR